MPLELTADTTQFTADTTVLTADQIAIGGISLLNVVYSPTLQAPITLSNPTATLTLASDTGSGIHQANPIPPQGALSLVGAAVRMTLAMSAGSGTLALTSSAPTAISGIVTPRVPGVGGLAATGAAPTLAVGSGTAALTFPRVMLVGVGGDQGYGRTSGYPWTTAGAGTAANTAIQTLGAYDIVVISGVFEGWDSSGTYDRDNLTQALSKKAATYTVTKSATRATQVFYYEIMNATISGNPYAQWQTLVDANNWYLYESAGGVGTKTPAGGGQFFINYSTAWPGAIGSAGAGSSICGTNYGTTSAGSPTGAQGPARSFGNYAAIKLLMRGYAGDSRYSFNAQMGSPSAAGIFLDEAFVALDGAGTVPSSYLDGINLAPGSQQGGGFPGLDTVQPVMARGIHNMFDQMQTMLALVNPGKTYYNFANFGQYANKYQFGTTTLTCGLENTLHGGLLENVLGAGASAWECFQIGNPNTGNTTYASGWPNLLANYYQGMDFCQAPKLVGLGCKLPAIDGSQSASWPLGSSTTPTTITATAGQPPSALECQLMRYGLCTTLLDDGYFAPGVTGYNWSLVRWYDEYGDDSLTQVNVKRGYLGAALTVRPSAATWAQGTLGVWSRSFANGIAIVNPRGNGSQTIALGNNYTKLQGTQQPSINNGATVSSVTLGDGDGLILLGPSRFIPQTGYTYTATTIADGQSFTITRSAGGFGVKTPDSRPLLFIDPAATGNLNPSPLCRTTATLDNNNLTYQSTGGPSGTGWAQGAAVVSGDSGNMKKWTLAFDVDQWGTSNPSPALNGPGAKYYLWRTMIRNFGHYDENTASFNIKGWRLWGRSPDVAGGASLAYPDIYMSYSNQRLTTENSSSAPGADFTRAGQPGGSADAVAAANVIAFDGGIPGTPDPVTFNRWFSEEIVYRANQNDPGTTPPKPDNTSVVFNWFVEGKLSNTAAFQTPVFTYQWNQWYTWAAGIGRMMRYYFWHYIVDGTGGRSMLPVGSYVGYGASVVDDSWCRAHIRDNAARSSFTITEYQPPSAWSDTSVTITLRKGRFASYSGKSLIITDNNGTEHYVGDFT